MTQYDQYCNSHPDFKNHLIKITSEQIQEDFKERDKTDSFLSKLPVVKSKFSNS